MKTFLLSLFFFILSTITSQTPQSGETSVSLRLKRGNNEEVTLNLTRKRIKLSGSPQGKHIKRISKKSHKLSRPKENSLAFYDLIIFGSANIEGDSEHEASQWGWSINEKPLEVFQTSVSEININNEEGPLTFFEISFDQSEDMLMFETLLKLLEQYDEFYKDGVVLTDDIDSTAPEKEARDATLDISNDKYLRPVMLPDPARRERTGQNVIDGALYTIDI